jgi:hypothetical protein
MMVLLDTFVRVSLLRVAGGPPLVVHGHLLLFPDFATLRLVGGHIGRVLAKRLLVLIDHGRMRVERFGMLCEAAQACVLSDHPHRATLQICSHDDERLSMIFAWLGGCANFTPRYVATRMPAVS